MIDIDELMTYDWVLYKGVPNRIEEISRPNQKVSLASSHLAAIAKATEIEPISLSKEILQLNGFTYEPNSEAEEDGWWIWNRLGVLNGNEYVHIAFRGDDVAVYDLSIMKGFTSGDFHLNYVHELQNIMRAFRVALKIERLK